jgi:hypothetical protein
VTAGNTPTQVFLVRSDNSAIAGNPIVGIFTDPKAAEDAVLLFKRADEVQMKERWKENWKHFVSVFYVDAFTADIPAEDLVSAKYKD